MLPRLLTAACVAAALLTAGCTAGPNAPTDAPPTTPPRTTAPSASPTPATTPATTPVPAPSEAPSPSATPPADGALTVEDLTLTYRGERGEVVASRPDDRSHRLSLQPDHPDAAVVLDVPAGLTARAFADGTAVLERDGVRVLGLGAATWQTLRVTDGQVRLEAGGAGPAKDRPLELWLGSEPVLRTEWGQREGGLSIAVVPAGWARTGLAGSDAVWEWLLEHEPDATGPGMRDQLECHAVGAAAKPSWNLEPWRPDVGLARVMLAGCNPVP